MWYRMGLEPPLELFNCFFKLMVKVLPFFIIKKNLYICIYFLSIYFFYLQMLIRIIHGYLGNRDITD